MTPRTALLATAMIVFGASPLLAQTAPGTGAPPGTATPPPAQQQQRPAPMPPASVPAPQATTPQAMVPAPAADARRASQIIGANIINEENRTVGEVHDLMVSLAGGATTAVLSVGGFLGIGERYVAVPLSELRWSAERGRWMLPGATVDSLKARPPFTYPERS